MPNSGDAKIRLILELKNKLKTGLSEAKKQLNGNIANYKKQINSLKETHIRTFDALKSEIPGASRAIGLLANPYVAVGAAVAGVGLAYKKAVNMAIDWRNKMAQVNVTAQLSNRELEDLSKQLSEIAAKNVVPMEEVPEAFNKILSAGLSVNEALKTLEPTLKASKAGFADIGITAGAAVSLMNASGIKDVNKIYDILFATVNKGNAEFADIAQYLPKIVPLARSAGISLQDTAGAYAYLTAQGFRAEQAATGLMNTLQAFTNQNTINNLKKIGINVFDDEHRIKGFTELIDSLRKSLNGLTDEARVKKLASIGLDMQSSAAISSMINDYDKLKETIGFVTDSQGQFNEAIEDAKQPLDSWKRILNEIKVAWKDMGDAAVPLISQLGDSVVGIIDKYKEWHSWVMKDYAQKPLNYIEMLNAKELKNELLEKLSRPISTARPVPNQVKERYAQNPFATIQLPSKSYKPLVNLKPETTDNNLTLFLPKKSLYFDKNNPFFHPQHNSEADEVTKPQEKENKTQRQSGTSITGSAQQIRNITFNIDTLAKLDVSSNPNVSSMSKAELERWINNLLMRAIRNVETSYS